MLEKIISFIIGGMFGYMMCALLKVSGREDKSNETKANVECFQPCPYTDKDTCCWTCFIGSSCQFACKGNPNTCKGKISR